MKIKISIDDIGPITGTIEGEGKTATALSEALPISSTVNRWGDEIYFYVGFEAPLEAGARSNMNIGELAYWPDGPALAIFFGPTPASRGNDPVAASDCNVLGRIDAPPDVLRRAKDGAKITVDRVD